MRYNSVNTSLVRQIDDRPTRALFTDKSETLWVNRQATDGRYETVAIKNGITNKKKELDDKRIFFFYETDEYGLLIGTDSGLYQLKDDKLEAVGSELGLERENFFSATEIE